MKKKGYEGFTAFKHHLKEQENKNINFSSLDKVDKGIRQAILKNEQEVVRTINMMKIGNIEDAIQKIKFAERVIIFARGFSEMIGQEMMVKFQLTGKKLSDAHRSRDHQKYQSKINETRHRPVHFLERRNEGARNCS
jgi:DNA-binding MurR/RpiR family transcriptional regulator